MQQELKIRIHHHSKIEARLKELGAVFVKEANFVDTYFNAPKGKVMKIVENKDGATVVRFAENNGKFDVVGREKIDDLQKTLERLTKEYGINKILKGTRKEYLYNEFKLTFNLIDDMGDFLIVTSDGSQESFIKDILNIQNPEYITVPFNEL